MLGISKLLSAGQARLLGRRNSAYRDGSFPVLKTYF